MCRPVVDLFRYGVVGVPLLSCAHVPHSANSRSLAKRRHPCTLCITSRPIIPSEARLYSGSIDLFRGHGGHGGHGPPLYPATSLWNAKSAKNKPHAMVILQFAEFE